MRLRTAEGLPCCSTVRMQVRQVLATVLTLAPERASVWHEAC